MLARVYDRPAHATRFVCEWTSLRALARRKDAWRALCEAAAEPNPFYAPDYLLACADDIERDDIRCVAIWRDGAMDSELLGLFPLMRARPTQGAFFPALEFYRNAYTCSSAPLLHRDDPDAVMEGFLDAFVDAGPMPRCLVASMLPVRRAAAATLRTVLARRGCASASVAAFERAAVETTATHSDYLSALSANRRKDIRRRERRLGEQGAISFRTVRSAGDKAAALEDFFRVEASGWKNARGTALACEAQTRRFATSALLSPEAEFDVLALDGRAVAVCASLVSQGVKYTVKTAYDETLASCSPGQVLDLMMLPQFTAGGSLIRADSCASPGHQVEGLWREREPLEARVFAVDPAVSAARVHGLAATLRSVARLKSWMKEQVGG